MTKETPSTRVNSYVPCFISEAGGKMSTLKSNAQKSLDSVNWYYKDLSRHHAEVILLNNGIEGSYLMRNGTSHVGYTISVRSHDAIKHYPLNHDRTKNIFVFGVKSFYSVEQLLGHFESIPVVGGESEIPVTLKYPYTNDGSGPTLYNPIKKQALATNLKPDQNESKTHVHVINPTQEGYLTKRGAIHKNWKSRWFTVNKHELKYFENRQKKQPIKVVDLRKAIRVSEDSIDGKKNCFRLEHSDRTFYFTAETPALVKDWIDHFNWKIEYYKKTT